MALFSRREITINGASVVWYIAMIGLFLCGIILFARYKRQLGGKWILHRYLLYLACLAGIVTSSIAIYFTFFAGSPLPQLLDNQNWFYWVLLVTLGSLAIGATYSFLVPEAEDLAALAKPRTSSKKKAVAQNAPEPALVGGGDLYASDQSPFFPTSVPGAISPAAQPRLPGELFSDAAGKPGPGSARNLY